MTRSLRQFAWLLAVLACAQGCQTAEESIEDDVKQLGLAYLHFQDHHNRSPSSWDELIAFAEQQDLSPDSIRRVRDANYTVTWDLEPGSPDAGTTVLAQPPGAGRSLMADGGLVE